VKGFNIKTVSIIISLFIGVIVSILFVTGVSSTLELKSIDLLFKLRGEQEVFEDVVLIDIDDRSLEYLGKWPWPRDVHARIIRYLNELGVKAVVFDVLFTEMDPVKSSQVILTRETKKAGNVYHAMFFILKEGKGKIEYEEETPFNKRVLIKNSFKGVIKKDLNDFYHAIKPVLPSGFLGYFAKGVGYVNAEPDPDGVRRRIPFFIEYKGSLYLPVACRAVLDVLGVEDKDVALLDNKVVIKKKGIEIPIDKNGEVFLNFPGGFSKFKRFSYADVFYTLYFKHIDEEKKDQFYEYVKRTLSVQKYKPRYEKENGVKKLKLEVESRLRPVRVLDYERLKKQLKGKIALIGASATAMTDLYPIPLAPQFPQVGIWYTFIDNFFKNRFLHPIKKELVLCFIILFSLITIYFSLKFKPTTSLLLFVIFIFVYLGISVFVFKNFNYVFPVYNPLIGSFGIFLAITTTRVLAEEREKRRIRGIFSRYVSDRVVEVILKDPSKISLGGERRRITIFFSDIREFTSFSENISPEDVVKILNEYLSRMTDIIFEFQGTLDKFIGDAIMALWGAPYYFEDHAERAIRASIKMQKEIRNLMEKWKKEGFVLKGVGMGINTGDVVVGNLGSEKFVDYTAIGDDVNLAARLEEIASPGQILVSEATFKLCKDKFDFRKIGGVKVKGKEKEVIVYEVRY